LVRISAKGAADAALVARGTSGTRAVAGAGVALSTPNNLQKTTLLNFQRHRLGGTLFLWHTIKDIITDMKEWQAV
jgi:hypothetical protein